MTVANTTTFGPTTDSADAESQMIWIPFVEPVPDWKEAMDTYGYWWHVHIYGVAVLFLMVTVYSLFNIIYLLHLHRNKELRNVQQTAFFIAITILMLIFSSERAVFMLLDAYNIGGTLPPIVAYLFISIGLPCMTSCFFLIFYAFYKVTRDRLARRSILSVKVLITVIVLHFVISISLDVAAGCNIYPVHLLLICQGLFIFCGILLAIMFFVLFVRIYKKSVTQRRRMLRIASMVSDTQPGTTDTIQVNDINLVTPVRSQNSLRSLPQPKVTSGGKLILVSAILLLVISILYLFGLFGIFLSDTLTGSNPNLWMWWGWEFSVRIIEVCLCWTISLAGTQPAIRNFRRKRSCKRRQSQILIEERRKSEILLAAPIHDPENALSKEEKIGLANDALDTENVEEPVSPDRRVSFSLEHPSGKSDSTEGTPQSNKRKGSLVPPTTPETIFESSPDVSTHKELEKIDSLDNDIEKEETPTTGEATVEADPEVSDHKVLEKNDSLENGGLKEENILNCAD